jgi:tetratricopeptide (TPR) repeat protein
MSTVAKFKETARTLEQGEHWQRALDAYRQALELSRGEASEIGLWNRIGDLEQRLGRPDRAVEAFEAGASAYVEAGLFNNAIALCNKILRVLPGRAEVYLRLGQISAAQGFLADARASFLEYAERMQRAGEIDASFAALREFAALSPEDTETRRLLAEQLAAHDRPTEAVEQLRLLLGQMQRDGRMAEAEAVRNRIRAIDPDANVETSDAAAPRARPVDTGDDLGLDVLPTFSLDREPGRIDAPADVRADDVPLSLDPGAGAEPGLEALEIAPIDGLELQPDTDAAELAPAAGGHEPLTVEPLAFDSEFGVSPHLDPSQSDEAFDVEETLPLLGVEAVEDGLLQIDRASAFDPMGAADDGGNDAAAEGTVPPLPGLEGAEQLDSWAVTEPEAPEAPVRWAPGEAEPAQLEEAGDFSIEPLPGLDPLPSLEPATPADERRDAGSSDSHDFGALDFDLHPDPRFAPEPAAGAPLGEPLGASDLDESADVHPAEPPRDEVEALRERIVAEPGDSAARLRAVELLDERGLGAEGDALLGQVHEALAARTDFASAARVAAQLLARTPDDTALHQKHVEYAFRSGDRGLLTAAYLEFADRLRALGNEGKARAVYQRVLDLDASNAVARAALAPAAPPRPAAPPTDYVDLGALVLDDVDAEATTRFTVDAEEPTGNEDEDFARMLSHFRRKVSENIATEDSSSHYDLGVAFKEMGLLDEAIAQFQVALRGGAPPLATLEILGECFVDKGQLTLATRVLERAMQLPDASEANLLGVHYLLARCDEVQDRPGRAQELLERVLAVDIGFRDGAARLRALRSLGAG